MLITKEGQVKLSGRMFAACVSNNSDFGVALISKVNGDAADSIAVEGSPFWSKYFNHEVTSTFGLQSHLFQVAPEVIQMRTNEPSCDIW